MRVIIFIVLISVIFARLNESKEGAFFTMESLQEVKKVAPFEVYSYEDHPFKNWSFSQVKNILNADIKPTERRLTTGNLKDIPTFFHTQKQWPDCVIPVKNQGRCTSGWAFAATEVLSDRFCIATNASVKIDLSPQDLVSCDYLNDGCKGGNLDQTWFTLRWKGVVTDACMPYESAEGFVPSCTWFRFECADKSPVVKYYAKTYYRFESIEEIKKNMLVKGPVGTSFIVHDDFMHYKGGIYIKTSDKVIGNHAIKVVGWGTEGNVDFWIAQNTWGPDWGENGYFRIKEAECQFENEMISGDPYY